MKKLFLLILSCMALSISLFSCKGIDPDNPKEDEKETNHYSEKQLIAFGVLKGTFEYDIYSIKTRLTFSEYYKTPIKGVDKDNIPVEIQGTVTRYYNSTGDSYEYYYELSPSANIIIFYSKGGNIYGDYYIVRDAYEIEIMDQDSFRIKYRNEYLWDWYYRI